jgi:hypothetical protein
MIAPFLSKLSRTVARSPDKRQRQVLEKEKPPGIKEGKPWGPRVNTTLGKTRCCFYERSVHSLSLSHKRCPLEHRAV